MAIAAYEIYRHWDGFKALRTGLWDWVKEGLTDLSNGSARRSKEDISD
jgi:hypothetical protein